MGIHTRQKVVIVTIQLTRSRGEKARFPSGGTWLGRTPELSLRGPGRRLWAALAALTFLGRRFSHHARLDSGGLLRRIRPGGRGLLVQLLAEHDERLFQPLRSGGLIQAGLLRQFGS